MGIKRKPISPRQKMINLMYIVLLAMLALNVSSDVLNGFSLVDESINRTTAGSTSENAAIYRNFDEQMKANPVKVKQWFDKARQVRAMSDSLYNYANKLKQDIVTYADGEDGDVRNIINKQDLEASTYVMLNPRNGQGRKLYEAINDYRTRILGMISDPEQASIINHNLATEIPKGKNNLGKNWQQYMFENTPAAAAVTLLSKLQSDVRYAEGVVLHTLVSNIDVKDIRVNELSAFVIPNSNTIVQGGKFSAHIIMAAVDTTMRPSIYVGGRKVNSPGGLYEFTCTRTGDFNFSGYIEMQNGAGDMVRRDFTQKYTVVAPSATVSADLMNVLYAGYDNPMSVSVPGIPLNRIGVSMNGGSLQPTGEGKYIARPTAVGKDAVITVTAQMEGRNQEMGKFTFRVRKLPDPTAYIAYNDDKGNPVHYRGGTPITKAQLMGTEGIGAAIDDGLLNISFKVLGFETVFFDKPARDVPPTAKRTQVLHLKSKSNRTRRHRTQPAAISRSHRKLNPQTKTNICLKQDETHNIPHTRALHYTAFRSANALARQKQRSSTERAPRKGYFEHEKQKRPGKRKRLQERKHCRQVRQSGFYKKVARNNQKHGNDQLYTSYNGRKPQHPSQRHVEQAAFHATPPDRTANCQTRRRPRAAGLPGSCRHACRRSVATRHIPHARPYQGRKRHALLPA